MASVLTEAYFTDETAAFAALEGIMWPNGPVCPHCGCTDRIGRLEGVKDKKGRVRLGLHKCYDCRGQFTVRKGTVFEASHLKLHQWFQATYLLCSSKKGCSSNQIARTLGITVKSAWFATHRIREAMRQGDLAVPFGSGGGAVESDETYIGRKKGFQKRRAFHHKMGVLTLIDRETKQARSQVITDVKHRTLAPILRKNIAREARLMTDEAGGYRVVGQYFAQHGVVKHGKDEYVHPDDATIHTNTAEGYFSVFKRGMKGVYQHCREHHLHRYLAEFDFRYNHRQKLGIGDTGRTISALRGSAGKRLTYKDSQAAAD
ncbi:MAG: IS1595 family transposase [Xanthobacteraceae bacterium]